MHLIAEVCSAQRVAIASRMPLLRTCMQIIQDCILTMAQAASEDELRYALGLSSYTTGKGKVDMKDTHMRPIEVFMCSVVSATLCWTCARQYRLSFCWCLPICCSLRGQLAGASCDCLLPAILQVRRMGYGDGFRWVAQYIK
jgi:hypothetical protein